MKSAVLEISNDDISGTGRPINFMFDSIGDGGLHGGTSGWIKSKCY